MPLGFLGEIGPQMGACDEAEESDTGATAGIGFRRGSSHQRGPALSGNDHLSPAAIDDALAALVARRKATSLPLVQRELLLFMATNDQKCAAALPERREWGTDWERFADVMRQAWV